MTLIEYLEQSAENLGSTDDADRLFAERIGVTKYAVRKWRSGERYPKRCYWPLIYRVTKWEVKFDDPVGAPHHD